MNEGGWISADAARRLLGVRAQTLYAYASRGLVKAAADPRDARRSLYRRAEVEELAAKRARSRKLADVASAAIGWGEPVLDSAITRVRDGRLAYRGHDALALAERATLEEVAGLLIGLPAMSGRSSERLQVPDLAEPIARLLQSLAARVVVAPSLRGADPVTTAHETALLLDLVADCVAGSHLRGAIHSRLAEGWGGGGDGTLAELIRVILVLLADHELNASTFAARVTSSTGASLAAALLSGLGTLSGPLHGGMSVLVRQLARQCEAEGARCVIDATLASGLPLPGFGHPLYPHGDIRAKAILARTAVPLVYGEIAALARATGQGEPNVDFALAAVCHAHGLPDAAPFLLFATARTAGWLAHAVEQDSCGQLIRPRARYVGP